MDLLFSDVVLPDAGGKELADWIQTRNGGTKILFTSGYVDEGILRRHGLKPETAFLQKPFTPSDLRAEGAGCDRWGGGVIEMLKN